MEKTQVPHFSYLTSADRKQIQTLYIRLFGAFDWASSPQGHDYWCEVAENLLKVRDSKQVKKEVNINHGS